jgi:hypothetical protein
MPPPFDFYMPPFCLEFAYLTMKFARFAAPIASPSLGSASPYARQHVTMMCIALAVKK